MPANQPLWLKAVHRLERAIGEPVEAAVRTDTYFDAITKLNRARRKAGGMVEGVTRRAWHTLNLPAGTDVRRMREQLARVERRVTQLSEEVSEVTDDDGRRTRVG
jgi:hypothetical protein